MKLKFIVTIIFFYSFLEGNLSFAKTNKILFKVNNQIITSLDILEEANYLTVLNSELKNAEKNSIYEISKKSLIRHKIKELEIIDKLNNYELDDNTLNNLLLNQFKKLGIKSFPELEEFFKIKKINKKHVLNRIKIQILWNEFIFAKYSARVKINKQNIKNELENKKNLNEYLLSEILFNLEVNEDLNEKFNLIQNTILKKGFSEAALIFSLSNTSDNGGNLGWIKETSLNKKIREQIENLEIGKNTKPIIIPGGYLIIKISDKRSAEIDIDLDKEIKQISKKINNEQLNQFSTMYFNKIKKDVEVNEY